MFALFLTQGLGAIVFWTPVNSLTAQKRLVQAGLGIALLSQSHAAEELSAATISTIRVGNLTASHDIVVVTRRSGFLSAASRRLLEVIRTSYATAETADNRKSRRRRRSRKARTLGPRLHLRDRDRKELVQLGLDVGLR